MNCLCDKGTRVWCSNIHDEILRLSCWGRNFLHILGKKTNMQEFADREKEAWIGEVITYKPNFLVED